MICLVAELNGLEIWQTHIGKAYLEARTNKRSISLLGQNSRSENDTSRDRHYMSTT